MCRYCKDEDSWTRVLASLRDDLDAVRERAKNEEARLAEVQAERDKARDELDRERTISADLRSRLNETETAYMRAGDAIRWIGREVGCHILDSPSVVGDTAVRRLNQAKAARDRAEAELSVLKTDNERLASEHAQMRMDLDSARADLASLQALHGPSSEERSALQRILEILCVSSQEVVVESVRELRERSHARGQALAQIRAITSRLV